MTCINCTRTTPSLFIRSFTSTAPVFAPRSHAFEPSQQPSRHSSSTNHPRSPFQQTNPLPLESEEDSFFPSASDPSSSFERPPKPSWAIQKAALREKLNGEAWAPRKKLSPDTMEGIRHLHATQPLRFSTPLLADHFKVSPEAIRRILKSKWRPNDAEAEARMQRWDKRGERIWSNLVEMGVKPPKRWRDMGVGRAEGGDRPMWKGRRERGSVGESVDEEAGSQWGWESGEDILPVVGKEERRAKVVRGSLVERM